MSPQVHESLSLHEACYQGRIDVVAQLLAAGADPNEPADPNERAWISCAGRRPRPLNCVAIAWTMTENHVKIASLLIEHGAVVDDAVIEDHTVEMVGGATDIALRQILDAARDRRTR
jgi:ankyrin repeat protein